jgi:hypothetical protein
VKLRLLVCGLMFVGTLANAQLKQDAPATSDQTSATPTSATTPDSKEVAREKALDDEFSKCIPNNAKYKNRCAMIEASKKSIEHSQYNMQYAIYFGMSNAYIKYLTDRESSGMGYCRLKGASQAAVAGYDPVKNINEIMELISGCMVTQYKQVEQQENELYQILQSDKLKVEKK